MTGSVYAVLLVAVATSLVVAMVLPAPTRAAGNEHGLQLALIGGGATAAIAMGVLALLDLSSASTISAVVACLFVAPCAWLARAPADADGWLEDEEDDDGGGSPPPHRPSDPPAPDDGLPGARPALVFASAPATWSPVQPAPALATASSAPAAPAAVPLTSTAMRVQRMLAAEQEERARSARELPRLLAAQAAERLRTEQEAQRLLAAAALVQLAEDGRQATTGGPQDGSHRSRLRAARPRADHPSIAHVMASNAHGSLRRRGPATRHGITADPRT